MHNRHSENPRCADCRFNQHDRNELERTLPGLASLGSAFGASISHSGLCLRHDRLVSPHDRCPAFAPAPRPGLDPV